MNQWEYVIKEVRLLGMEEDNPDEFPLGGSTLPKEKHQLKEAFNEEMVVELSDFGKQLQLELMELGAAGWEVYHIERRDIKALWYHKIREVDYRFFAKRRSEE